MTVEERLFRVIAETLETRSDALSLDSGPADTEGWDSLAHVNIISEIEAEFDINIPIEDFGDISRIRDFLTYVVTP